MDNLKIEDLEKLDDYVPEDPNTPIDDFEISEIEIEDYMPEDLKNMIRRYNEIHKRTVDDLLNKDEDLDDESDNSFVDDESDIVEDNNNLNLKNIF